MSVLLVSPYFIDSYKNNLSMGSAVALARNLSKVMRVVVLTSGRTKEDEELGENLRVVSTRGFLIPDPINYMISLGLLLRFVDLVRLVRPEVVVVSKFMFFSSLVIPLARLMKVPVITVTDTFPGINWFPVSKFASIIMWFYARIIGLPLLWMSDKVVLLYRGLIKVAKKYNLDYVVIPNGVEPIYFEKLPIPVDIKKPKDEFWVGFVGRPESVKGYTQALSIASDLQKYKNIKFVFVGGNRKVKVEKNKMFLGFRRDIMNIYQLFDVLILPSHAEGLPNVVMQAMACEIPVVANAVGGVVELIDNKRNGFLVELGDVKAMKRRILDLYRNEDLRVKIGKAARETVKKDFNWSKILRDYQELIKQVCAA
jgi:glycosyltransferase involved in cell wall biosynthesis